MINIKANDESEFFVDHTSGQVKLFVKSHSKDNETTQTIIFACPIYALQLAERIREVAFAAQIYKDHGLAN